MDEKYLWDKTGEDAEIERLENALRNFRYRETAPPALPAKIIPFEPKQPRKFFRFAFAFAACAVLLIIGLSFWFGSLKTVSGDENILAENIQNPPPNTEPAIISPPTKADTPVAVKTNIAPKRKFAAPQYAIERKAVKSPKSSPAIGTNDNLTAQNNESKTKTVRLTKEEKYAYDQLMLALSITSSNLKIIKDKTEGAGSKN